jgi:hypothetical protein
MWKKLFVFFFLVLLILGCSTTSQQRSDFTQHDAMYESWSHLWYSWSGYKTESCDPRVLKQSKQEAWWGTTYECPR